MHVCVKVMFSLSIANAEPQINVWAVPKWVLSAYFSVILYSFKEYNAPIYLMVSKFLFLTIGFTLIRYKVLDGLLLHWFAPCACISIHHMSNFIFIFVLLKKSNLNGKLQWTSIFNCLFYAIDHGQFDAFVEFLSKLSRTFVYLPIYFVTYMLIVST